MSTYKSNTVHNILCMHTKNNIDLFVCVPIQYLYYYWEKIKLNKHHY